MANGAGRFMENRLVAATLILAMVSWVIFLGGLAAVTSLGYGNGLSWWTLWLVFFIIGVLTFLVATDQLEGYRTPVWGYIILASVLLSITATIRVDAPAFMAQRAGAILLCLVFYSWIGIFAPGLATSAIGGADRDNAGTPRQQNTDGEPAQVVVQTQTVVATGDVKTAESPAAAPTVVRARALFSYKANPADPHEISLEKDEIVTILDRKGNWWRARKEDGTLGIVPSNYMEVI